MIVGFEWQHMSQTLIIIIIVIIIIFIMTIITGLLYINFSDGQKIAKKLLSNIKRDKVSETIPRGILCLCQSSLPDKIYLPEALDPSFIGNKLHKMGTWGSVASGKKIAIIDAYLAACRSKEEIEMLKEDASNN